MTTALVFAGSLWLYWRAATACFRWAYGPRGVEVSPEQAAALPWGSSDA